MRDHCKVTEGAQHLKTELVAFGPVIPAALKSHLPSPVLRPQPQITWIEMTKVFSSLHFIFFFF